MAHRKAQVTRDDLVSRVKNDPLVLEKILEKLWFGATAALIRDALLENTGREQTAVQQNDAFWRFFDVRRTHLVTLQDWLEGIERLSLPLSSGDAHHFFRMLNTNRSLHISKSTFLQALQQPPPERGVVDFFAAVASLAGSAWQLNNDAQEPDSYRSIGTFFVQRGGFENVRAVLLPLAVRLKNPVEDRRPSQRPRLTLAHAGQRVDKEVLDMQGAAAVARGGRRPSGDAGGKDGVSKGSHTEAHLLHVGRGMDGYVVDRGNADIRRKWRRGAKAARNQAAEQLQRGWRNRDKSAAAARAKELKEASRAKRAAVVLQRRWRGHFARRLFPMLVVLRSYQGSLRYTVAEPLN